MKRRKFLKRLGVVLGLTTFISFIYPMFMFFAPQKKDTPPQKLTINKNEIAYGMAREYTIDSSPIVVINRRGKGYIALSRVCTHLGCLVTYSREEDRLICPCHAAIFTSDGNVISGPAPLPLKSFPLTVEGDLIIIG